MHSYLVLVIYWILSVLSTYIVRYYNNKKHAYRKIFAEEVPLSKKILENLAIWLIMPLAMPFVLLYLLGLSIYTYIDKRKYKNRPRPVPKEKRFYLSYKIPCSGVISRPAASTSCRSFFITSAGIHLRSTLTVRTRLRLRTMSIGA